MGTRSPALNPLHGFRSSPNTETGQTLARALPGGLIAGYRADGHAYCVVPHGKGDAPIPCQESVADTSGKARPGFIEDGSHHFERPDIAIAGIHTLLAARAE